MKRLLSLSLAFLVLVLAAPVRGADIVGSDQFWLVTLTVESVTVDPRTGVATVTGSTSCEPNTDPGTIVEVSPTYVYVNSLRSAATAGATIEACQPFAVQLQSLEAPFRPGKVFVEATVFVTSGVPDQIPHTSFVVVAAETVARPQ